MSSGDLFDLYTQVRDRVKSKGFPFDFTYDVPPVPASVGGTRLYMCTDDAAGDQVLPPHAPVARANPKHVGILAVAAKIVIFARSTLNGARRHEHEALALQIVNMVHVAVHEVVLASKTRYRVTRYGFVSNESTDGWAGRVYEMRLSLDTPLADVDWLGEAGPEGSFTTSTTTLAASGVGASDVPNATTRLTP